MSRRIRSLAGAQLSRSGKYLTRTVRTHDTRHRKPETGSGWFKAPRTLPLVLALLAEKQLTGGRDVSRVYLELLSRHMDGGVIEIGNEADHAYAAGYTGTRAIRTWNERMQLLQKLGFIKSKQVGGQRYKLVLLTDPVSAVAALYRQKRVPADWWEAYRLRLIETRESDGVRLFSLTEGYEVPANVLPPSAAESSP